MPFSSSGRRDLNSSAKADIHPVAERHSRMGGGRSHGGQPGTPINPPLLRIDGCSIGRSYLPCAPNSVSYANRVLRVLLGIGWGIVISFIDKVFVRVVSKSNK